MTTSIFRGKLLPLFLLAGLAGCTSSPSTTTSTATTTKRVASTTTPGTGKGHWVDAPTTEVGSHLPRRYWVSDEPDPTLNGAASMGSDRAGYSARPGVSYRLNGGDGRPVTAGGG